MNLLMVTKVILSTESFLTDIAFVGPFISVCSFVDHQVVRFCEVSEAESTAILVSETQLATKWIAPLTCRCTLFSV